MKGEEVYRNEEKQEREWNHGNKENQQDAMRMYGERWSCGRDDTKPPKYDGASMKCHNKPTFCKVL